MPNMDGFRLRHALRKGDERSESHKLAMGHPLEEPLKIYPVSDLVNSPKTDDVSKLFRNVPLITYERMSPFAG